MSFKLYKKLIHKKYRDDTGLFLVEGKKSVSEILASEVRGEMLYVTEPLYEDMVRICHQHRKTVEVQVINPDKMAEIGAFSTNTDVVLVAHQWKEPSPLTLLTYAKSNPLLVLDTINDPGNLGTIIRTADWFDLPYIGASIGSVDVFNPKVISATKGSCTRTHVAYLNLESFLTEAATKDIPITGTFMEGTPITEFTQQRGIMIMGSESHGISKELTPFISQRVTIPRIGKAESLNVGVATGIILSTLLS